MGARVHVPVRIVLDADDVEAALAPLTERFESVLSRTLARTAQTALARHAGPVTFASPTFRWTGEAVEPTLRAGTERRLAEILATCTSLLAATGDGRAGEATRERFDPARAAAGGYAVPSYAGEGAPETITFSDEEVAQSLEVFATLDAAGDFSLAGLRRQIAFFSKGWPALAPGAHPGLLWLAASGDLQAWFIVDDTPKLLWLGQAIRYRWNGQRFEPEVTTAPPVDVASLTVIGMFDAHDIAGYTTFLRGRDEAEIRAHLTTDTAVNAELDRRARRLSDAGIMTAMELQIGGASFTWYGFTGADEVRFTGTAQLYPVTSFVRPPGRHDGTGTGGAGVANQGDRTGAAGGAEGGGDEGDPLTEPLRFISPKFDFSSDALVCEPFLGEPLASSLGAAGASLQQKIAAIASRLQIAPCDYAGQFCLMACQTIVTLAIGIGDAVAATGEAAVTEYRRDGRGNLGDIDMRPRTIANALLAKLAGAVPLITDLAADVRSTYQAFPERIEGMYAKNWAGWTLHFLIEFDDPMRAAIGRVFGETCRILMLQLLDASRAHIENRQTQIETLAHSFFVAVLPSLIDVATLMRLKDRLTVEAAPRVTHGKFSGETAYVHQSDMDYDGDRATAIHDVHGRVWTVEQLQSAITLRRGVLEEIEPLVKHLDDLPRSVEAMQPSEAATRAELSRVFEAMLSANADVRARVAWSWEDAFKYAPIDGDLPGDTPAEIGRNLHGIHLIAHQELAPRFGGSRYYAEGVRALFEGAHALEIVESLAILGALVIIAVLCPPLGYVAGVAVAGLQYLDTIEKGEIRDALINPEQLVDLAELDVERFAAALGLALSIIPEAPSIIRGAYRAGAAAIEEGTVTAARRVALTAIRRSAVEGLERVLETGIAEAIGREFIKANVMNEILSRVLRPLLQSYYAQRKADGSVGGVTGALALIAWSRARRGAQ